MKAFLLGRSLRPDFTIDANVFSKKVEYIAQHADKYLAQSNRLMQSCAEDASSMRERSLLKREDILKAISDGLNILAQVPETSLERQTILDRHTLLDYKESLQTQTQTQTHSYGLFISEPTSPHSSKALLHSACDAEKPRNHDAFMSCVQSQSPANYYGSGLEAMLDLGFLKES